VFFFDAVIGLVWMGRSAKKRCRSEPDGARRRTPHGRRGSGKAYDKDRASSLTTQAVGEEAAGEGPAGGEGGVEPYALNHPQPQTSGARV